MASKTLFNCIWPLVICFRVVEAADEGRSRNASYGYASYVTHVCYNAKASLAVLRDNQGNVLDTVRKNTEQKDIKISPQKVRLLQGHPFQSKKDEDLLDTCNCFDSYVSTVGAPAQETDAKTFQRWKAIDPKEMNKRNEKFTLAFQDTWDLMMGCLQELKQRNDYLQRADDDQTLRNTYYKNQLMKTYDQLDGVNGSDMAVAMKHASTNVEQGILHLLNEVPAELNNLSWSSASNLEQLRQNAIDDMSMAELNKLKDETYNRMQGDDDAVELYRLVQAGILRKSSRVAVDNAMGPAMDLQEMDADNFLCAEWCKASKATQDCAGACEARLKECKNKKCKKGVEKEMRDYDKPQAAKKAKRPGGSGMYTTRNVREEPDDDD